MLKGERHRLERSFLQAVDTPSASPISVWNGKVVTTGFRSDTEREPLATSAHRSMTQRRFLMTGRNFESQNTYFFNQTTSLPSNRYSYTSERKAAIRGKAGASGFRLAPGRSTSLQIISR